MSRYETLSGRQIPVSTSMCRSAPPSAPTATFTRSRPKKASWTLIPKQILPALAASAERWQRRADTLYFGGGTPILLGARRIERIVSTARRHFGLQNAEITLEANPASTLEETLRDLFAAGVNRLSFGMQSADEEELRILGRRHTAKEAALAVAMRRRRDFPTSRWI